MTCSKINDVISDETDKKNTDNGKNALLMLMYTRANKIKFCLSIIY